MKKSIPVLSLRHKFSPFVTIILVLLFSCSIEKQISRKDQKAVQRVEAKRTLLDQVFFEGLKIHPCANETSVLILRDTITTIKTDTIKYKGVPDTIKIETIKTITYTDTIKKTIVDGQMVKILTDTINAKNKQLAFKDGQIIEKDKRIKEQGKKIIWLWIIISMCLAGFITGIYLKLKPKIK